MKILFPLVAVLALGLVGYAGGTNGTALKILGIAVPYVALAIFLGGMVWRMIRWARTPVPFPITTTGGQQKTLPWIRHSKLDNPSGTLGTIGRMALEVLLFRSLFRNTKADVRDGKVGYGSAKWLWVAGLAFHWTMLFILLRHLRFFLAPIPGFVHALESVDGLFQIGVPVLYLTDVIFLLAVTYLFLRRVVVPQVSYISLAADYFPLFLLGAIAVTGVLMRYFLKVDILKVKELAVGLATFHPRVPDGIGPLFFAHLLLVCALFAYFPFSKLVHLGGVFLSPTRNLPNDSRAVHHVNPWNPEVKVHSYADYENDFREKMKTVDLPLDKESP